MKNVLVSSLITLTALCLPFSSLANNILSSNSELDECLSQLASQERQICRLHLNQASQYKGGMLARQTIHAIRDKYNDFYQQLESSEQKITFAIEVIHYLTTKNLIKPYLIAKDQASEMITGFIIPLADKEKAGYILKLTESSGDSIQLLNALSNPNTVATHQYSKEIRSIFNT